MRTLLGLALLCSPMAANAQNFPRIPLKPTNATLDAEFIGITSVREVADGRVIVTDGRDQQLYVADFTANNAKLLGRKGRGPGEWQNIGLVYATSGDSSILADFGTRRWLLFDGAKIVLTVPPDHPGVVSTGSFLGGIDRFGNIMLNRGQPYRAGRRVVTRADSQALVFINRDTGKSDTVTKLREQPHLIDVTMDSMGRATSVFPKSTEPNAQAERARLFNDGWLAVTRLEPLRIEWRSPTGQWTRGKPLPVRPDPVDAAERKAMEARRAEARAEAKKIGFPPPSDLAYPTTRPALSNTMIAGSPDGRLLLARTATASRPNLRYLVVNRRGDIDGEITLGPRETIIGFGARSVYVITKDDDDIQRLRRHPWP